MQAVRTGSVHPSCTLEVMGCKIFVDPSQNQGASRPGQTDPELAVVTAIDAQHANKEVHVRFPTGDSKWVSWADFRRCRRALAHKDVSGFRQPEWGNDSPCEIEGENQRNEEDTSDSSSDYDTDVGPATDAKPNWSAKRGRRHLDTLIRADQAGTKRVKKVAGPVQMDSLQSLGPR